MTGVPVQQTVSTYGGADYTGLTVGVVILFLAGLVTVYVARRHGVANPVKLLVMWFLGVFLIAGIGYPVISMSSEPLEVEVAFDGAKIVSDLEVHYEIDILHKDAIIPVIEFGDGAVVDVIPVDFMAGPHMMSGEIHLTTTEAVLMVPTDQPEKMVEFSPTDE